MDDHQATTRLSITWRSCGLGLLLIASLCSARMARAQNDVGFGKVDFDRFRLPDRGESRKPNPAPKPPRAGHLFDALRNDPESTQLSLGRLALDAGRLDDALKSTNQALQMRPGWYDALLQRAEIYTAQTRFSEAIVDCNQAIAVRPDDPRAYLCRIDTRARKKDFPRALREAEKALARWPENPAALAYRGNLRADTGLVTAALADFDSLLKRLPNHTGYRRDRLRIEIQADRPDLALRDLDWFLERQPFDARALTLRAESLVRLARYDEADAALSRAIAADPTNPSLFRNRAELRCSHLDRIDDGLQDFDECFALDPNDLEARIERASVLHRQGRLAEAIADLDLAIARKPVWTLIVYRALIQEESGDLNAALADLDRAIDLEPKAGPAYFARALVKTKLGDLATSAHDFEQFTSLGSPASIEGAGPIESVVRAIQESQHGDGFPTTDPQVQRAALRPSETRR